jgi:segregation and condensation protein B
MSEVELLPELKQIVGALLFVSKQPLKISDIRRVLVQVGETWGGATKDFAKATEADLKAVLDELQADLNEKRLGIHVSEIASGYRLENDSSFGPWLRHLLEKGRATRLSRPALETLAIVAYRQPCMRSEIEAVRGVAVDQILKNLLEMQLVRIVGRSELPGRPWLFGTTQKFLEHFGLKGVNDLPGTEELRRMEAEQMQRQESEQQELVVASEEKNAGKKSVAVEATEEQADASAQADVNDKEDGEVKAFEGGYGRGRSEDEEEFDGDEEEEEFEDEEEEFDEEEEEDFDEDEDEEED